MSTKKKTKKHNITKKNCSPMVEDNTVNDVSCFTPEIINKLKTDYNKKNPSSKISSIKPDKIWKDLKDRMGSCDSEECWLEKIPNSSIEQIIKDFVFSPKKPKSWKSDPDKWLTNYDLDDVMDQYEETFRNFDFIGPTFIDFDAKVKDGCVENELCKFDLSKHIKKNKNKLAVIFNLDKHTQDGSHWVSLFIDIKNRFIFYFDSAGDIIPGEIAELVKRIKYQGRNLSQPIHFRFHQNYPLEHQYENTECGMYSLFFIISMLKEELHGKDVKPGTIINAFKKHRITDDQAQALRNVYFN